MPMDWSLTSRNTHATHPLILLYYVHWFKSLMLVFIADPGTVPTYKTSAQWLILLLILVGKKHLWTVLSKPLIFYSLWLWTGVSSLASYKATISTIFFSLKSEPGWKNATLNSTFQGKHLLQSQLVLQSITSPSNSAPISIASTSIAARGLVLFDE